MMAFREDRNLPSEHIKEDADPPGFVKAIERAQIFGKRSLGQPDRISNLELGSQSQLQESVWACRSNKGFHDSGRNRIGPLPLHDCQIASNPDPSFACNNDPASVREWFGSDGAETGGAEPHIAEQSRSRRAASGEREVMRGS
jgi:hypothetical protein